MKLSNIQAILAKLEDLTQYMQDDIVITARKNPKNKKITPDKPEYCKSTLNRVGGALDLFGKINQATAFSAIVLTGGAAAEGAIPAYAFGTFVRYVGTTLQSFSGNTKAQSNGIVTIFSLPANLSPVGDTIVGSAATLINDQANPDPC